MVQRRVSAAIAAARARGTLSRNTLGEGVHQSTTPTPTCFHPENDRRQRGALSSSGYVCRRLRGAARASETQRLRIGCGLWRAVEREWGDECRVNSEPSSVPQGQAIHYTRPQSSFFSASTSAVPVQLQLLPTLAPRGFRPWPEVGWTQRHRPSVHLAGPHARPVRRQQRRRCRGGARAKSWRRPSQLRDAAPAKDIGSTQSRANGSVRTCSSCQEPQEGGRLGILLASLTGTSMFTSAVLTLSNIARDSRAGFAADAGVRACSSGSARVGRTPEAGH